MSLTDIRNRKLGMLDSYIQVKMLKYAWCVQNNRCWSIPCCQTGPSFEQHQTSQRVSDLVFLPRSGSGFHNSLDPDSGSKALRYAEGNKKTSWEIGSGASQSLPDPEPCSAEHLCSFSKPINRNILVSCSPNTHVSPQQVRTGAVHHLSDPGKMLTPTLSPLILILHAFCVH